MSHKTKIFSFFLFSLIFLLSANTRLNAATLFMSSGASTVVTGNIFTVQVFVNTQGVAINTSDAIIQFPPDLLSVVSVSKSSSIFSIWVEDPNFSNNTGQVSFNGGVPNPGYTGTAGQLISITFQAKKAGTASVLFSDSSVRANDGLGTDVLSGKAGASFTISSAPVVQPLPPPAPAPVKKVVPVPVVPVEIVSPEPEPVPIIKIIEKNPEIFIGSKFGSPAVFGASGYKGAEVLLSFVTPDGVSIYITDTASADGSFVLSVPGALKRGEYTVTAVMKKTDGTKSDVSNQITVHQGSIVSDIGWEIWCFVAFLVLIIFGLISYIYLHLRKTKKAPTSLKHGIHEAETVLHKSFDILREDVADHVHKKIHTTEDRKKATALEKEISDAESVISKEIRDIENSK